ncbi:MAG: lysostaphin resistance A-like protein, partial [Paracoccaceae bacterium]
SEELVFRGYLQQQLAARYSSRWVWWVLPALLFGLAHFDGESTGVNAWLVVADTFLIGLIAGDLTARTGNLGAAVGLHLANNTAALLVMATEGTITGLSLFVTPFAITDARAMRSMLLADLVVALVLYTMYLFIMALRQRRRLQSSERNLI